MSTYKPRSVPRASIQGEISSPSPAAPGRPSICAPRHRDALAAYPKLRGCEQPPSRVAESLLLGLAPEGGCLAADIAADAGGLLHHLFTLTQLALGGHSLWPVLWVTPDRELSGIVLCGARTFLKRLLPLAIARPTIGSTESYRRRAARSMHATSRGVVHFRGRGCSRVNVRRSSRYTSWFDHPALEMRLPTIGTCEAGCIPSSGERSKACIEGPGLCC